MSDDITQKLRVTMPDFKGLEISCPCRIRSSLMKDAADEIEKLTRECDEARAGIERLRKDLRQGFPIRYETAAGCLCPAGANASCQNSFCPRRNPPGVTCGGGRP